MLDVHMYEYVQFPRGTKFLCDEQKYLLCVSLITVYISMNLNHVYINISRLVATAQALPSLETNGRV